MTWGTLLLQASFAASLTGTACALLLRRGSYVRRERALTLACILAPILLTLALVLLVAKFVLVDVGTFYVWRFTNAEHPWYYRLSGVWGGQAGTLLLWAWYASLPLPWLRLRWMKKNPRDASSRHRLAHVTTLTVLLGLVSVLSWLALDQGLFLPTSEYRVHTMGEGGMVMREFIHAPGMPGFTPVDVFPEGFGLNPLLLTPFMVIHPWVEFAAYALSSLLFAILLAYVTTEDRRTFAQALPIARVTWLVYTLAIALGALWAYYTLSFGGYWAWDPVETANLLPWLALTAFLHVAPLQKRHGDHASFAPVLGAGVFLLTLLATFLTRSGVWNGSVHAFITDGVLDVGDAGARLQSIMQQEPHVQHLLRLLLGSILLTSLLFLHRAHRHAPREQRVPIRAFLVLHASLLAWALASPSSLLAGASWLGRVVTPWNYAIGLSLFVVLALALPGAYLFLSGKDEARQRTAWHRRTLPLAALVFALVLAVCLVLLLMGINGTQRRVFDSRAPLFALLLTTLLAYHFTRTSTYPRYAAATVLVALAAGGILAILLPGQRLVAFVAPMTLAALHGTLLHYAKASRHDAPPWRARVANLVFLASGVLGLLQWTSPPADILLLGTSVRVAAWWVPLGVLTSLCGLAAAHLCLVPAKRAILIALSLLAVFAYGYGVGALLALAGLMVVLLNARPGLAPPRAPHILHRIYRGSLSLLHVGVVLAMLGYGASTYYAQDYAFTQDEPLELGQPAKLGAYTLTFTGSEGRDEDGDGVLENVDAHLQLTRDGARVGEAVLSMTFVPSKDHYDPSTVVDRRAMEDVYFNANYQNAHAMYSEQDGWTRGHGPTTQVHSAEITKLALNVRILPHVNLLWTGIFLGLIAMLTRTLTRPKPTPQAASAKTPSPDASPTGS